MAFPAPDILTREVDPLVSPTRLSRIVDIQPDPRGGYFALVDVAQMPPGSTPGILLKLDDTFQLMASWTFNVTDPGDPAYTAMSVAGMSVGPAGIYIIGTSFVPRPGPYRRTFVLKLSLDGVRRWARVYRSGLIEDFHATGRGIVRLPPPDDDGLMLLMQTSVLSDGSTLPPPNDPVAAATFAIDNDGNPKTGMFRFFYRGQFVPTRLRLLSAQDLAVVGRTRTLQGTESWMACWVRYNTVGNPKVGGGAYDWQYDTVFNDIAEVGGRILTVGTFEQARLGNLALAAGFDPDGNVLWAADYDRLDQEFFSTDLNVLRARGDTLVAGGMIDTTAGGYQPWMLRLDKGGPDPVWQKAYEVVADPHLPSAFHSLLLDAPNRVIAGGSIVRRIPEIPVDCIPFYAVSQTEPGLVPTPSCSFPSRTATRAETPKHLPGPMTFEAMGIGVLEWIGTIQPLAMPSVTICTAGGPE